MSLTAYYFLSPQGSKEFHFPCFCFNNPSVLLVFTPLVLCQCHFSCGWTLSRVVLEALFLPSSSFWGILTLVREGWQSVFWLDLTHVAKHSLHVWISPFVSAQVSTQSHHFQNTETLLCSL